MQVKFTPSESTVSKTNRGFADRYSLWKGKFYLPTV